MFNFFIAAAISFSLLKNSTMRIIEVTVAKKRAVAFK